MHKSLFIGSLIMLLVSSSSASTTRFKGYNFEAYAISDLGYRYYEIKKSNGPHIKVGRDEEYSLVIENPLPVRVAVAVTIDGLNVIDGKRTTADKAEKWIIDPYSSLTMRGWQTDRTSLRRFIFTDKSESYARWKGARDNKNYTYNLGVIGVAYFWNSTELAAALRPPTPFAHSYGDCRLKKSTEAPATASRAPARCEEAQSKAGTGMGQREINSVVDVEFNYDTGMYRAKDILVIYYEFAQNSFRPQPFLDDRRNDFAPEMP